MRLSLLPNYKMEGKVAESFVRMNRKNPLLMSLIFPEPGLSKCQ